MQNFIVLGIIPGTSVELTFYFWLYAGMLLASVPFLKVVWRRRNALRTYFVAYQIARAINRYQVLA